MAKDWKKALWDPKKKWWQNLWFADWRDAMLFFFIIFTAWAFIHDTAECREVMANPCAYCPTAPPPINDSGYFVDYNDTRFNLAQMGFGTDS